MKLIKLDNEFYLLKEEEIKLNDVVNADWRILTATLPELVSFANEQKYPKVIASTTQIAKLPLLNIKQIENIIHNKIDVKKIAIAKYPGGSYDTELAQECFSEGYNKSLEDNADKKFTFADLKKAYIQGGFDSNAMARVLHKEIKAYKSFEEYYESITKQKTEWEVEVEIDESKEDFLGQPCVGTGKPLITNGYINVLKLI